MFRDVRGKYSVLESDLDPDDPTTPLLYRDYMAIAAAERDNHDELDIPKHIHDYSFASAEPVVDISGQDVTEPPEEWVHPTICANGTWMGNEFLTDCIKESTETHGGSKKEASNPIDSGKKEKSGQSESETKVETKVETNVETNVESNLLTSVDDWQIAEEFIKHAEGMMSIHEGNYYEFEAMGQTPSQVRIEEPCAKEVNVGGDEFSGIRDKRGGEGDIKKEIGLDVISPISRRKLDGDGEDDEKHSQVSTETNKDVAIKSSLKKRKRYRYSDSNLKREGSTRLERVASRVARERLGNLPRHLKDSHRWHSTPSLIHPLQAINIKPMKNSDHI